MNTTYNKRLSSAELYKKYNIPPTVVHHIAVNDFSLHEKQLQCFANYFLRTYNGAEFLHRMVSGCISVGSTKYLVIFDRGASRGKILKDQTVQVVCSFREPQEDFNLPAYVIVQIKTSGETES